MFTRPDGTPISSSTVNRSFGPLYHAGGIRRIRFHDLRHSCGTLLLEQGVDLATIKDLLGHSQIHITADMYAHVRFRLQRDEARYLRFSAGRDRTARLVTATVTATQAHRQPARS